MLASGCAIVLVCAWAVAARWLGVVPVGLLGCALGLSFPLLVYTVVAPFLHVWETCPDWLMLGQLALVPFAAITLFAGTCVGLLMLGWCFGRGPTL